MPYFSSMKTALECVLELARGNALDADKQEDLCLLEEALVQEEALERVQTLVDRIR